MKIINYGDNENHIKLNTVDSNSITKSEIESRRMIFEQMEKGEKIMAIAPAVAPREGKRIAGLSEMNVEDFCSGKIFEDSVCYSYCFVDIHRHDEPTIIKYITHDKTPTIRLSSMISKDFSNLLMAGRYISTDRETNSAIRVKASCMAMGQTVATVASIAIKDKVDVKNISIDKLKYTLDKNAAIIPGKERYFVNEF